MVNWLKRIIQVSTSKSTWVYRNKPHNYKNPRLDSHAIVLVVCYKDYHLLHICLKSLAKNWLGNKHIIFISEDMGDEYKSITTNILPDWKIEHHMAPIMTQYNGWYRQQCCKLWAGLVAKVEWLIILDCKNALIEPVESTEFINEDYILLNGISEQIGYNHEWSHKVNINSKSWVNGKDIGLCPDTTTPWVFNVGELRLLWDKFDFTIYNETEWDGTEFFIYWYWVNKKFNWVLKKITSGVLALEPTPKLIELNPDSVIYTADRSHLKDPVFFKMYIDYLIKLEILNNNDYETIQNYQRDFQESRR